MGGRSSSSGFSSGSGVSGSLQIGDETIEFEGTLRYGGKDKAVPEAVRKNMEAWENKKRSRKAEYAISYDKDGNPIGKEVRGSRNSVRTPEEFHSTKDATFTHVHPRTEGEMGGTFSDADLWNFANFANKTMRATAKEGTYSISKTDKFDKDGFMDFMQKHNAVTQAAYKDKSRELYEQAQEKLKSGEGVDLDEYSKATSKLFNTYLVNLHEGYRKNQKKYGYTYTLEKNG